MSLSLKAQTLQTLNDTNVIFHDYVPDVVLSTPSDTLKIDINQDGLLDIQFYFHYYPFTSPYFKTLNSNCKYASFPPTHDDSLTSSTLYWWSGDDEWTVSPGDYRLGIKILDGTNNYYGWIHILKTINPNTMTIDKYAFCKIANYPFLYGQTTISTNMPNINITDSTNVYLGNSGNVIVESGKLIKSLTLTSTTGVVVASQNNINSYSANISTAGIVHGTYIVQVQFTDLSIYTKQIVM